MKKTVCMVVAILLILMQTSSAITETEEDDASNTVELRIIATSDLHGKFMPWDYLTDSANTNGSMTQLATAISQIRNENTLVLDAGDVIQDNNAELFLDDDIHPMAAAMNYIGYDAWTTGNHEYNYGISTLKKFIAEEQAVLLTGNVIDEEGNLIGEPYAIFERAGLRIAVIGMVTPIIARWDSKNLQNCKILDPVEESRKILDALKGKADIYIALMHMGMENEYDTPDSGCADLAAACPEFNLIIASHEHLAIEGQKLNGILAVENANQAQTLNVINMKIEKSADSCEVLDITSKTVKIDAYEPDEKLTELLMPYHERALENSHQKIGMLVGGNLRPENEIAAIPAALTQDTALVDLILRAELYYSGADVASAFISSPFADLKEGNIRNCDVANIYKYGNTLYTLRMTGAQLKTYMEWSAQFYQQYHDGDLTIAFEPGIPYYSYDMFAGVNYEIDISKPVGQRIVNLTKHDGTPVADNETFIVAVNNYRAGSQLLSPGIIFKADDMPELAEAEIHGSDIGGIREMVRSYIINVCGGILTAEKDDNWKIIGNDWDKTLHDTAVEQINEGLILVPQIQGKPLALKCVTTEDLK